MRCGVAWGAVVVAALAGCGKAPDGGPSSASGPALPAGWRVWGHENDFRVPIGGPMVHDRALSEWYEKGMVPLVGATASGTYGCLGRSRSEGPLRFAVVQVRLREAREGGRDTLVEDTFAMIARRSPDMKEVEGAGSGYGQGKVYEGEGARLFVRVGRTPQCLYVVSVRGDRGLDAQDERVRASFGGIAPINP